MKFRRLSRMMLAGAGAALVLAVLDAAPVESVAETKIRLLSDALRARDTGDLALARTRLEELLLLVPGDATVARLLTALDQAPERTVTVSGGTVAPAATATAGEVELLAMEEEERIGRLIAAAREAVRAARTQAGAHEFSAALDGLDRARAALPENLLTEAALGELAAARSEVAAAQQAHLAERARAAVEAAPPPPAPARVAVSGATAETARPVGPPPADAKALLQRARSQYLAGDAAAAEATLQRVQALDPAHPEVAPWLQRIAADRRRQPERDRIRAEMLAEVEAAWRRPGVGPPAPPAGAAQPADAAPLLAKLDRIVLPSVSFNGLELSRVVATLTLVSEEFDASGAGPRGVNIVLLDPARGNPPVHLTLRNVSLRRVLDFLTSAVGYQYEVQADAVVVRPGGEPGAMETRFFPVSRSTVLRMTGRGGEAAATDPRTGAALPAPGVEGEGEAIRNFLQLAGVSFDAAPGSTLAFDGSQLIVTQTARNLERLRNILARYHEVRQVEIEAKFMEVQEGALEELGVQWRIATKPTQRNAGAQVTYSTGDGVNRTLNEAFSFQGGIRTLDISSAGSTTVVNNGDGSQTPVVNPGVSLSLPALPPVLPGGVPLGAPDAAFAAVSTVIGEFDVNAIVRALNQKSGTELLSAPKLTVLSGNAATITVAQELRYPQSYGQIQSQVGTGSISGGGSAGVSITSGTPQEFTTRNVGVELRVTPTVEEDDHSISLDLHPKVTEFEGFVEYGGPSVAISGGTTVTVPPGFFQPIFAVREVATKVTIWDGATLVMGGLTREDVKKVRDRVPVLGSIPLLGRLFRSEGESAQKRNLLIFVTANLVSPGGSLKQQRVAGVAPGALFQNPTLVTPAGGAERSLSGK